MGRAYIRVRRVSVKNFIVVFSIATRDMHVYSYMHTYIPRISIRKVVRSTVTRST